MNSSPIQGAPRGARSPSMQQGVTLVELMVAVAINLVLVLAATLLFLNTRSTQKAADERGELFETGQFAMELMGRELSLSAFYPVLSAMPPAAGANAPPRTNVLVTYDMAAEDMIQHSTRPLHANYRAGLYGCEGATLDATHVCAAHTNQTAPGSDALAVAYFTTDAMSLAQGQRADCTRSDVANDAAVAYNNTTERKGNSESSGVAPAAPMMVINHYFLAPTRLTVDGGRTVDTFALRCRGNGMGMAQSVELVQGIEQLQFSYGVRDPVSGHLRHFTATEVNALTSVVVDDQVRNGWQRVVSVRVCMVVRSRHNTAARDARGQVLPIRGCDNADLSVADGAQLRRFERTFAVKNRLGATL